MAIKIETSKFEAAHGRKPRGAGVWAFIRNASHGQPARTIFSPCMTFREACAWARKEVRAEGFQDAFLQVGA